MKRTIARCAVVCGALAVACGSSSSDGGTDGSVSDGGSDGAAGPNSDGSVRGGEGGSDASLADSSSGGDGSTSTDGASGSPDGSTEGSTADGAPSTTLSPLHVEGNLIKNSSGTTVVLRGVAIPDIGALDVAAGGSTGVSARIDEILGPAALDVDVIRMPVYPGTCFNGGSPYYSPEPFPVGTAAPAGTKVTLLSAADYISQVLKPAVDYATSKNLYVIVDYHQIDNVTGANGSGAAAVTFWQQIAPVFSSYPNVLYEAFNEPIDSTVADADGLTGTGTAETWSTTFTNMAQSWVTAIRAGAPNNLIVVGSPSWSQYPNGGTLLTGSNLVFTAHIYPGNWPGAPTPAFQDRFTTAVAAVPVFVSEWGYALTGSTTSNLYATSDAWATSLQTYVNGNGASWTAWVADSSWGPPMFANASATALTDFGMFVQNWLRNP